MNFINYRKNLVLKKKDVLKYQEEYLGSVQFVFIMAL